MGRKVNIIGFFIICLVLAFPPACSNSGGGDSGDSSSQNLTVIITFAQAMDTSVPAGVAASHIFPDFFGPKEAHAGTTSLDGCLNLNYAGAVLLTATWLTSTQLKLVYSGVPAGSYQLLLNSYYSGCTNGFRTAAGVVLAAIALLFTFVVGNIVYLNAG